MRFLPYVLIIAVMAASTQSQADDSRYSQAAQLFQQLQQGSASIEGRRFNVGDQEVTFAGSERFDIVPVPNLDPGLPPYQMGVAVWFELSPSGQFVNPVKHRWDPLERFYVWINPAVPVTISLHQNYPEDRPPSRQVYPDVRYPATFQTFMPGPHRLPVLFEMDDDLRNEIMSMVVVRADNPALPVHGQPFVQALQPDQLAGGNTGAEGVGGEFRATAEAMTRFNDEAVAQGTINGESSRFTIVGPSGPEMSMQPADVQFYMLGCGLSHQFQLTLFK